MDKNYLLKGHYVVLDENKNDLIIYADFGQTGLNRVKEKVKSIDTSNLWGYGVLGSVRGIHLVVKNALATNISNIYLVGREIPPFFSYSAFEMLYKKGINELKEINGFSEYIEERYGMKPLIKEVNLDEELVDEFRRYVSLKRIEDITEYKPNTFIPLSEERREVMYKIREQNENENSNVDTFKNKKSITYGDYIYARNIEEGHKLILLKIMHSGHIVPSQYGDTKEIISLMVTIEDPYKELFSNKQFLEYGKDLVSPSLKSDSYTYGLLINNYRSNFNQLEAVINRLKENLYDRASIISLLMPDKHLIQKSN